MIEFNQIASVITWLRCKRSVILLSFLWLLGLSLGFCFVFAERDLFSAFVSSLPHVRPSFPAFLIVTAFPIILTVIAIHFSLPVLIYAYSPFKSFTFSTAICSIAAAYPSSGWLIRFLLLFSDSLSVLVLLFLWFRFLSSERSTFRKELWICAAAIIFAGLIDYFLTSPYLAMLMNYS